jgi:hypothetical protein
VPDCVHLQVRSISNIFDSILHIKLLHWCVGSASVVVGGTGDSGSDVNVRPDGGGGLTFDERKQYAKMWVYEHQEVSRHNIFTLFYSNVLFIDYLHSVCSFTISFCCMLHLELRY